MSFFAIHLLSVTSFSSDDVLIVSSSCSSCGSCIKFMRFVSPIICKQIRVFLHYVKSSISG